MLIVHPDPIPQHFFRSIVVVVVVVCSSCITSVLVKHSCCFLYFSHLALVCSGELAPHLHGLPCLYAWTDVWLIFCAGSCVLCVCVRVCVYVCGSCAYGWISSFLLSSFFYVWL